MPIHVHDSGAWRQVHTVWTNQSGVWVKVQKVHVHASGAWRKVHGGDVVVSDPIIVSETDGGNPVSAGVIFHPDGRLTDFAGVLINSGQWWSEEPQSAVGNDWRVRCLSLTSGSWNFEAAAVGSWVQMNVERTWRVFVSGMAAPDTEACTAEFQIAPYPSGSVVDQFTVEASAFN